MIIEYRNNIVINKKIERKEKENFEYTRSNLLIYLFLVITSEGFWITNNLPMGKTFYLIVSHSLSIFSSVAPHSTRMQVG